MTCPWCSYENQPRVRFCGSCGRGLQLDSVCASCSTPNPSDHVFCDACGEPIADLAQEPPPRTPNRQPMPPSALLTAWKDSTSSVLASARGHLEALGLYGWEAPTLAGIILLALVLRLVSLADIPPNVSPDEADNLQVIYRIIANTGPGFFEIDWTQAPAFNLYLSSWFIRVFGETIAGARMASVVLSTLSLVVFYFVARQYDLNKPAALAATFLLATSLWYLHFSRTGWYNIHVALYTLLVILTATLAIRRESLILFAAAGLFAALAMYGYFGGRAVMVALIVYLPIALVLHKGNRKRLLAGYAVMLATTFVLFLPHLSFALENWDAYNVRTRAVYIFNEHNRAQFGDKNDLEVIAEQTWDNIRGFILLDPGATHVGLNARYIPGSQSFIDRLTGVLFWLGMLVSLVRWRRTLLWWVFFVVMLFPSQVLSNGTPDGARAIGAAPVFYLFVALAVHWLFELSFNRRWWVRGAIVASVAVIACLNVSSYFSWMNEPETAAARQPAVEVSDFEVWQALQKKEAEAGRAGFNVGEWLEMKEQGTAP